MKKKRKEGVLQEFLNKDYYKIITKMYKNKWSLYNIFFFYFFILKYSQYKYDEFTFKKK